MPAAPAQEHQSSGHRAILPSRLIPGMALGVAAQSRTKLVSIQEWQTPALHQVHEPQIAEASSGRSLSELLLPAPGKPSQRIDLAQQVLADFLLLGGGFTIAAILEMLHAHFKRIVPSYSAFPIGWVLLYGGIFTLLGYSERLYHPEIARSSQTQVRVVAKVFIWSTLLVTLGLGTSAGTRLWLVKFLIAVPINFLLLISCRKWRTRALARKERSSKGTRNVLIVGAGELGRRLAHALQEDHAGKRVVCGFLDEKQPIGGDILGHFQNLAFVVRSEFIDEIFVAVPHDNDLVHQAIWQARRNHIDVKIVPDLFGADPARVTFETFRDIPVISLWEQPMPFLRLLLKRVGDLFLGTIFLVLASPLLAAIALVIGLDSPGPVIYRAPRVGLKGRKFLCYKFRTMVVNADQLKDQLRDRNERKGAFFKLRDDPRLTRIGKILRRYSLDELPQLWNVLRGDMSLVGPRPHPIDDVQGYKLEDFQRLDVTPGLTGLWQITARHDPSFERSVALDREYIGRWSLAMDFRILCKTLGALLRGEGA